MGFFFTSTQRANRKPIKPGAKAVIKGANRHHEALQRLGCNACPLNTAPVTTPKMVPLKAKNTKLLFLGNAPDKKEDQFGFPFKNNAGSILRKLIPDKLKEYCSYDNVINCYTDKKIIAVETECCKSRRVLVVEELKPQIIVGTSIEALRWATGLSDVDGLFGRLFLIQVGSHVCYFLMAGDLKYRLEHSFNRDNPLQDKLGHAFKMQIKKVCGLVDKLTQCEIMSEKELRSSVETFDGSKESDFENVISYLKDALTTSEIAIDIETQGVRPYGKDSKILTVAISYGGIDFAFAFEHKQSKWTQQQLLTILSLLEELLKSDVIKIAHNSIFEVEWFVDLYGPEVVNHSSWEDTQLQAHILDERKSPGTDNSEKGERANVYHGLNFLCKMYFGLAFKGLFKLNKACMENEPLQEILVYNAVDTKQTLRLWNHQNKILKDEGLYDFYKLTVVRQPTVALMQFFGMPVNQNKVKQFQQRLTVEIADVYKEINKLEVVQKYIQDYNGFNPLGDDALTLFRDYLERTEIQIKDGSKIRWSVDKNVLDKIDHPLAKLIIKLRNRTKMKSTYVDEFELGEGKYIWPDNHIHCNFNTTFTTTGRTSSSEPNMQNFPQRNDSWVRDEIEAPKGYKIVAVDYGQLEACTGGMCSRDPYLVDVLWNDYDMHMVWATEMNKVYPQRTGGDFNDPKVAKKYRSLIKNKLVFPAFFGATDESIAGYLNVPVEVITRVMKKFWTIFASFRRWQNETTKKYYDLGYVETPLGRRRHLPMTRNELINASIQGLASDIVCDAMCRLSMLASKSKKWYLHPRLNIHDDISLIIPDEHLEESIVIIVETLLTPHFNCINVPMSVTVSVGQSWGSMTEVGKFWSHRDI